MKKILYLLTLVVLVFSCEKENSEEIELVYETATENTTIDLRKSANQGCYMTGPTRVTPNSTVTFLFPRTSWQVSTTPPGNNTWDFDFDTNFAQGFTTMTVNLRSDFTCGRIRLQDQGGVEDGECFFEYFIAAENNCDCNNVTLTNVDIKQFGGCPGDLITFEAEPNGATVNGTYNWSVSNGSITGGQGTRTVQVATPPTGTFVINVTFNSDCSETASGSNLAQYSASCGGFGF